MIIAFLKSAAYRFFYFCETVIYIPERGGRELCFDVLIDRVVEAFLEEKRK